MERKWRVKFHPDIKTAVADLMLNGVTVNYHGWINLTEVLDKHFYDFKFTGIYTSARKMKQQNVQ